jgi:hypothetical protein
MNLNELEIFEDDFDLFVALEDNQKIEFLFDAIHNGVEAAALKQMENLTEKYVTSKPLVSSEDYQLGVHRLCITSYPDTLHINSTSLKAIRTFINKLFNDGVLLMRMPGKKTEFDIYRFFRKYKVIGKGHPISSN